MTVKPPQRRRVRKSGDDNALLLHAMYLMAQIDGAGDGEEQAAVLNAAETLPDLRESNIEQLVQASRALVKKYGGLIPSLEAFLAIKDPTMRLKCYLVSAEVAYASGDINSAESQLLESMEKILQLDSKETQKIVDVLALRYATTDEV
jgi:tellurite resistance protein